MKYQDAACRATHSQGPLVVLDSAVNEKTPVRQLFNLKQLFEQ